MGIRNEAKFQDRKMSLVFENKIKIDASHCGSIKISYFRPCDRPIFTKVGTGLDRFCPLSLFDDWPFLENASNIYALLYCNIQHGTSGIGTNFGCDRQKY